MRLGAHWGQVQAAGQIVITGADKPRLLLQPLDDGLLHLAGETTAGAKIHQPETRHIQRVGQLGKINQFVFQGIQRLINTDLRGTEVVYQLADHRQQRHFPHDHFAPGAFQANMQLAVIIADLNLSRVIAEIPQPLQVVFFKERQAGKPLEFLVPQTKMLHSVDLLTNGISIDPKQIITTAAELSRDLYVVVVVKNGLLHMQFIRVGIQQRMQNR